MGGGEETSDKPQYILRSGAGRNLQTGLVGTEKAFASPVLSHLSATDNKAKEKYGDYVGAVLSFLALHPNYLRGME